MSALIPFEEALGYLLERARPVTATEEVGLLRALGRVVARRVTSAVDVPPWDNSAMDGYALRAVDVPGEGEAWLPVSQRIAAGATGSALAPGTAARIFTGAPVPPGADTVVMQEVCREDGGRVRVPAPVRAGANVRPRGNDIAAGSEVLAPGTRLRPQELGLAASVGVASIEVCRRLRVSLFSTGDELVAPGERLDPGQIYNSNRYTLLGLLQGLGCEVLDLGVVADDIACTREAVARAADGSDVFLTSGGVSVGEEDHVRRAIQELGQLDLWRVRIKPGKPLAYGRVGESDFIGLPGNPVSALVTFLLFVRPFLLRRMGARDVLPVHYRVAAGFRWSRPGDRREFLRARIAVGDAGEPRAVLFARQGSDVLTSAAWAHGLVELPEGTVLEPGDPVRYLPFAELLL
jgi:molybdopterin molybdotransferase